MNRQISQETQTIKHQGQDVDIVPTRIADLVVGDLVIGPCGHEREVRIVTKGDYQTHILFKGTTKMWLRPNDDEVFKVIREHG